VLRADSAFDLVLMDMQMPVLDGVSATRRIRGELGLRTLPVIAMTANALEQDRQRCEEAGMDDFLSKPIQTGRLFATLARWIARAHAAPAAAPAAAAAATADPDALPQVEGLDTHVGLQYMAGRPRLYLAMLDRFVGSHADSGARIRQSLAQGDDEGAVRTAHTLKGLAGTLGAIRLQELARTLETAMEQRQSREVQAALIPLEAELQRLVTALRRPRGQAVAHGQREEVPA
jgi:CheY-like chemotaxis protein